MIIFITLASVFVVLPRYGIRTLPGRVEYLSEPEPQTVEYVARPPAELGKQLLFPWVSEQFKESAWSNARGKWVVWKGAVHSVEPMLKPSRIVLVHEYEAPLPFYTQRFGVIAEFDPLWIEHLKHLSTGETVYFRAKLVAWELAFADVYRYGLDFGSYLLIMEDGQIVDSDEIAATLVDLAYASFRQLDELVEEAESIAAVSKFFEDKLKDGKKRIAIETIINLVGIDTRDKYWLLDETPLAELRARKDYLKSSIEQRLQEALNVLHYSGPLKDATLRHRIEQQAKYNNTAVEAIKDASKILRDFWEEERRSPQPDISELALESLLSKLPATVGAVKTIMEGIIEYGKLDAYETIVGACHLQQKMIESHMEQIHDGVAEVADIITQEIKLRSNHS